MYAVAWVSAALTSFCIMAVAVRELSGEIDTFQVLFLRSVVGVLIVSSLILLKKDHSLFRLKLAPLHLLRNSFHFGAQYCWFIGIGLLPLAEVFALEFTVPIWTLLIATLFLGEEFSRKKIIAVTLGFLGVLIIVKPGTALFDFSSLYVLASALGFAVAFSVTKFLTSTQQPLTILFYMCVLQMPMGLIPSLGHWQLPSLLQSGWILALSCAALSAHFCLAKAMQKTEVTTVMILDFFRLPLIGLVGFWFYNEGFEMSLMIGAILMLAGNIINLYKRQSLAVKRVET